MIFLFKHVMFRLHANFPGCIPKKWHPGFAESCQIPNCFCIPRAKIAFVYGSCLSYWYFSISLLRWGNTVVVKLISLWKISAQPLSFCGLFHWFLQDTQNMAMVKMIADTHGRLDICVNSVGDSMGGLLPLRCGKPWFQKEGHCSHVFKGSRVFYANSVRLFLMWRVGVRY